MNRKVFTHRIDWQGITVEVLYEPDWLGNTGNDIAHLQLRSISPECAPLPVSETGYRSHFTSREDVLEGGGPVVYSRSWLDHAATSTMWRDQQEKARQFSLL